MEPTEPKNPEATPGDAGAVLHELEVRGRNVAVVKTADGATCAAYGTPLPPNDEARRIEEYLENEGFLTDPPEYQDPLPPDTAPGGVTVRFNDGAVEFYRDGADVIAHDPQAGTAALIFEGKTIELRNIASLKSS